MPIGFNPAPPTPSTKNTINSVTIGTNTGFNIRDFLLNKNLNLISTSAYQNYTFYDNSVSNNYSFLSTSINGSPKIGEPVLNTMVGNGNITIPFGLPLETEGLYHMDNLIILNQYQNTEPDYNSLTIIDNLPQAPTSWGDVGIIDGLYPTKPNEVIDVNGLLAKSNAMSKSQETGFLSTKASDATLMNLYLDVTKQINASDYINFNSNVTTQIKGYLDEYGSLNVGGPSTDATNVIGSILNGQGVGVSNTGVVPNFDIRSSLAGRVLGATGIINDTKLGLIGGQQLALALANNAAFNIQQDILGSLNVQDNILSLVKGDGVVGFRPNYSITVPSSTTGKLLNGTAQILGFTLPRSFLSDSGSIFQDENKGAENIARANEMILNTGKGQVQALLANMTASIAVNNMGNTFRSGYAPAFNDNKGKEMLTDYKLYAYYNGEGHFINPLAMTDGVIPDIQINRNVSEFSFKSPEEKFTGPRGNSGYENHKISDVGFTWTSNSKKDGIVNAHPEADEIVDDADVNGRALKKSLLVKTQALFNSKGMLNLITAKGQMGQTASQIQTAIVGRGISHGNAVMGKDMFTPDGVYNGEEKKAEETYCRSWTTLDRYDKMKNLVRHRGLDTTVPYRRNVEGSVLDDNGMPKIAPYSTDNDDPKKFMFSIENLAWNDSYYNLLPCERGPGDLLTGKKGRIMWFPPYNINFTENNAVSWDSNQFIGRGESVYTYSNTERSGTLSFQVIVDHPSYINSFKGSKVDDHYVSSFFAGCVTPDQSFSNRLTAFELDTTIVKNVVPPEIQSKTPPVLPFDGLLGLNVYFPNDVYTYVEKYENGLKNKTSPGNQIDYAINQKGEGEGIGYMAGQETSKTTYNDRYNFGLNGVNNEVTVTFDGFTGKGFSPSLMSALKTYLHKPSNLNIVITVTGYATLQGLNTSNDALASKRANTMIAILRENLFPGDVESQTKRVKKIPNKNESAGCDNNSSITQDEKTCKGGRYVKISNTVDWSIGVEKTGLPYDRVTTTTTTLEENPFYGECGYFEKLTDEDSFIFDKFRDKIKYFHPAFHSTTPEGLNARLTFLLQCTRQGPTLEEQGANNLAFGRPPVCILRIGDFYNTKIIIDNIGLDYEPLVWDLNPEGIGVQPMIANVNMSFKFIGGSTLLGPINKLQNALSFNYFANTQVYDVRADYISKKVTKKNPTGGYQITNDAKDFIPKDDLNSQLTSKVLGVDIKTEKNINQTKSSDKATDGVQETETSEPTYIVSCFSGSQVSSIYSNNNSFNVTVYFCVYDRVAGEFVDVTPEILDELYTGVDGTKYGFKLSVKAINSKSIDNSLEMYESFIPKEEFINYTRKINTIGNNFEIPIKQSLTSTEPGIFKRLFGENFIISISRTTQTTSDIMSQQNIRLS